MILLWSCPSNNWRESVRQPLTLLESNDPVARLAGWTVIWDFPSGDDGWCRVQIIPHGHSAEEGKRGCRPVNFKDLWVMRGRATEHRHTCWTWPLGWPHTHTPCDCCVSVCVRMWAGLRAYVVRIHVCVLFVQLYLWEPIWVLALGNEDIFGPSSLSDRQTDPGC